MTREVEAVLAALPRGSTQVEVHGAGPLGDALRDRLGTPPPAAAELRPAVVVETTGQPGGVAAALARVDDLGTVVLAGPPEAAAADLDAYADLHVRGLTLVGVPAAGRAS